MFFQFLLYLLELREKISGATIVSLIYEKPDFS